MKSFNEILKEGVSIEVVAKYPDSFVRMTDDAIDGVTKVIEHLDDMDTTKLSAINKNFRRGLTDLKSAQKALTIGRRELKKYVK